MSLGYKICIRAYLNGDGTGYKTHLSLFFVLIKGEYDPLLKWPFDNKVSLILIDQNHIVNTLSRRWKATCMISHDDIIVNTSSRRSNRLPRVHLSNNQPLTWTWLAAAPSLLSCQPWMIPAMSRWMWCTSSASLIRPRYSILDACGHLSILCGACDYTHHWAIIISQRLLLYYGDP